MTCKKDDICSYSLENLKSLANQTNKELQSLHTKKLFSNFCTNHFELLLEDIEKGRYVIFIFVFNVKTTKEQIFIL